MSEIGPLVRDLGEKTLIRDFIRPLFNSQNRPEGVGDDCAMIPDGHGDLWLFSTDRVPSNLIALDLGILDYLKLGRYLAALNLSDIAACGGQPLALLLNLGLPDDLPYGHFQNLCRGFGEFAAAFKCEVLGGDMTWSQQLSISATSIGRVKQIEVLGRRGAKAGDCVFVTKPIGVTPAAFAYHLRLATVGVTLPGVTVAELNTQFTEVRPEIELGQALAASGCCTSCMDNTDGIGQSLTELAEASEVRFVIRAGLRLPRLVVDIADLLGCDAHRLAFSAGADFALVGTLRGSWDDAAASTQFGRPVQIIGQVEAGSGVVLQKSDGLMPLDFQGWNYFSPQSTGY